MSMNRNDFEEQPVKKKSKRDGLRLCLHCGLSSGLRCLVCSNKECNQPFPEKQKNWTKIEEHSKKMTPTYIKEKLYNRMDQLSTKPGWTGILFLVHDVDAGSGRRVYTHSYSTKGSGQKLEKAMKGKVINLMKSYLFADQTNSNAEPAAQESSDAPSSSTTSSSTTASLPSVLPSASTNTPISDETSSSELSTTVLSPSSNTVSSNAINPIAIPEPVTTLIDLSVNSEASAFGSANASPISSFAVNFSPDSNTKLDPLPLNNANAYARKDNSPPYAPVPSSSASEPFIPLSSTACTISSDSLSKSVPLPLISSDVSLTVPPMNTSPTPASSFLITSSQTVDIPPKNVLDNRSSKDGNITQADQSHKDRLTNTSSGSTIPQSKRITGKIVVINGRKYFQLSK